MNSFSTTPWYWILTNVIFWFLEHLILYSTWNVKISQSITVPPVNNDKKLGFREHINTVWKKANLKLHSLNRISRFLSSEEHVLIINAYIKSLFNYYQLIWMFCYRGIMHKMNNIQERSLRLLLKNYKDNFQDLLSPSDGISIHQRCKKLTINRSIQIYPWPFSWSNEWRFLYQSKYL